jgi:hypothetical protein
MDKNFEQELLDIFGTVAFDWAEDGPEIELSESVPVVVFETAVLQKYLRPFLRRKIGETPTLKAVEVQFGEQTVTFTTNDGLVLLQARIPYITECQMSGKRVCLDLLTVIKALAFQGATTRFFLDDEGHYRMSFRGGWVYIPQYDLPVAWFSSPVDKQDPESEQKIEITTLCDVLSSMRKLIASAVHTEFRMVFGEDESLYACNGTTVMQSDCFFLPIAIRDVDLGLLEAVLATQETGIVELRLLTSVEFRTGSGNSSIRLLVPRRYSKLAKQYTRAIRPVQGGFLADARAVHKALTMFKSLPTDSGYTTLIASYGPTPSMVAELRSQDGKISEFVVSRETRLPREGHQQYFRIRTKALLETLSGFASEDLVELDIDSGQLLLQNTLLRATVIMGAPRAV